MFSENGKKRNSLPPFLDNGELRKALFKKELLTHKKEFAESSLQFMVRMAEVRKAHQGIPFSKELPSFLKSNFSYCFMHLENEKITAVNSTLKKVASASVQIISAEKGIERFKWAMENAISIAESESPERIKARLPAFFSACANVCIKGREMDWGMFASTYTQLRPDKAALLSAELSTSNSYPELYEQLSKHHSKLIREKMGAAFSY